MNLKTFLIQSSLNGDSVWQDMVYISNVIDQETPQIIPSSKEKDHPSNVTVNGWLNFNILIRKKDKIKIIKLHPHHTNTSQPGKYQLVMFCTAAGNYAINDIKRFDQINWS